MNQGITKAEMNQGITKAEMNKATNECSGLIADLSVDSRLSDHQ